MKPSRNPHILKGAQATDARGTVRFVNNFSLIGIKRFYQVENASKKIIRAFHGHVKEAKYVYVVKGAILLCGVYLDDMKKPSKTNTVEKFQLTSENPQVVYIPPGYANGFKALEKNTIVIIFSTSTLAQSLKDDYRFPFDYWGKDVWKK